MQKQKSGHIINMASVFGIKMFAPVGRSTAHQGGCARVDRRAADGTALPKHPLHDDLTWRDCHRTVGEQFGRSDRKNLREFMKMAIPASAIARAIAYAIEQPVEVEVDEMVIRPTVQDF